MTRKEPRVFGEGELEAVLASFGFVIGGSPTPSQSPPTVEPSAWVPGDLNDSDVLETLFGFSNGHGYRQLFDGDLEYGDASNGDWRLIKAVAWVAGPDADQVERIVRMSQRARPKWDERRGSITFLRWQVNKAIAEHVRDDSFYDGRGANALPWFSAGDGLDEEEEETTTPSAAATVAVDDVEDLPPIPEYPIDCLPDAMRMLVEAGVQRGLDAALVAGAALAAAAIAIGNQVDIRAMSLWFERAILWIPLIAPTGCWQESGARLRLRPVARLERTTARGLCRPAGSVARHPAERAPGLATQRSESAVRRRHAGGARTGNGR